MTDIDIVRELVPERLLLLVPVLLCEGAVEGLLVLEPLGVGVSERLAVLDSLGVCVVVAERDMEGLADGRMERDGLSLDLLERVSEELRVPVLETDPVTEGDWDVEGGIAIVPVK